jgi:hypothetical protein
METTIALIADLVLLFKHLHLVMEARNLWTMAAMTALLLKGKQAHLYVLAKALPCPGKLESRVQKLRRWVSNPKITAEDTIAARLHLVAPLLTQLPELILIIDRTEWTRLGVHVNLFLCSIAFHGRSFPLYWTLLPTRGCSSLKAQKALLTPVLTALAAHPLLAPMRTTVVADREFCAPPLARWLKGHGLHFCLRLKKHYHISRADIPSIAIGAAFPHCQPGTYYFFADVRLTTSHQFRCNVCIYWRQDCQEPLALMTDREEAVVTANSYHDRMFIETLNRDLKSSGYDLEHGKMTDSKRLENLLIPTSFAYVIAVIQGHVEELIQPVSSLKKRTLSLFTRARNRMIDLLERTPLPVILQCFQQFFQFLFTVLLQQHAEMVTHLFRSYAKRQSLLLGGVP